MDPTLQSPSSEFAESSTLSPIVEDLVESYVASADEPRSKPVTTATSIVEDRLAQRVSFADEGTESDEENDGDDSDAGVRVTAVPQQPQHPVDPVTGKVLPPRTDPLTGRLIHAKVDRESTIQHILDEEELDADEYEEIYEEEIVAIQEPGDEYEEPPLQHSRVAEEPASRAKQILEQRAARERQRQNAAMSTVRSVDQQPMMPPVMGRPYQPQRQRTGVPENFFNVPVDNPVEASIRSQFEPGFGRAPDHRNNFFEDRDRLDASQPTLEQEAALAAFSRQPHRDNFDPALADEITQRRQQEEAHFAEIQRNQIRKDQYGRPAVVQQQMPRVLPQRHLEPAPAVDDGGFDLIEQTRDILPRIVPQSRSPSMTAESRLISIIQEVVRKELDARAPAQQQMVMAPQQQMMMQPQQQMMMAPQQQMMMAPQQQPIYVPIFVQAPPQQPFYAPPIMQSPMMQQPPMMQQSPMYAQQPMYMAQLPRWF